MNADFEHRCFQLDLSLIQSWIDQARTLIGEDNVTTLEQIGIILSYASGPLAGLFAIYKFAFGKGEKNPSLNVVMEITQPRDKSLPATFVVREVKDVLPPESPQGSYSMITLREAIGQGKLDQFIAERKGETGDEAFANHDISMALPPFTQPARLLHLPEVMDRVGLRRSAIYQHMSEGRFPKPRSLGPKCVVWVETEIGK